MEREDHKTSLELTKKNVFKLKLLLDTSFNKQNVYAKRAKLYRFVN